ncbi:unnamed protein product [Adineta ricciae]|uniref:Uncharacterized protein n=1 Tax=Adineta ricciae TaxID=249248 RepID=A0A815M9Y8_ADIRI|nr:unnamed protein product [Adineta ricciae]
MATASSPDLCLNCSSKYNRDQLSLCQCKHCSQSFCFDCMKEHRDEMDQDYEELSSCCNEAKQVIETKKTLIDYIKNLTAEKVNIDAEIDDENKCAQAFILELEAKLESCTADVKSSAKKNMFKVEHLRKLLKDIEEFKQQAESATLVTEYDLPSIMPKCTFKFKNRSKSTTDDGQQDQQKRNTKERGALLTENEDTDDSDMSFPDENYFSNRDKHEETSFVVNCMATDGINIMYSSIANPHQELIAYCYLQTSDVRYRKADPSRLWKQSRIIDMIWWDTIDKFVCATENGIYLVEFTNPLFRISHVKQTPLPQVRIAANAHHIWVHTLTQMMIYDTNFQLIRSFNFSFPRSLIRASFCLTDNVVAFALIRHIENGKDILQVELYDHNMVREKRIRIGISEASCTIRTDGSDRFYVAFGQQRFCIVSSSGSVQTVNLGKQANNLVVVNSHNVVLTKARTDVEPVRC